MFLRQRVRRHTAEHPAESRHNASPSQQVPVREDDSYEEILLFFHGNLIGKPCAMVLIISTEKIQLCQATEKNDSDRNVIAKDGSVLEQTNRLRFLFVWAVAQSPRKPWKLRSLMITPPNSFEMSRYQSLNKAAQRP